MDIHRSYGRSNKNQSLLYKKMNELGVENFSIELIEDFPCDNVKQLRKREDELIKDLKPKQNMRNEFRTEEEIEYNKKCREDNKEYLKDYDKMRNEKRKEYTEEYDKQYYIRNKERIQEAERLYRANNQDKIKERDSAYYQKNKDAILQKQAVKCICECGSHYTHNHKARHLKAKKHQEYLLS